MQIRGLRAGDEPDLYDVCVRTGDNGGDATGLYSPDALLPDVYLGPYLRLEPDLALVVDDGDRAVGYVVGTADTARFVAEHRRTWLPRFAASYPLPDPPARTPTPQERLVALGHRPESMLGLVADGYPAHLHIDLLPVAQGQGLGRALIDRFVAQLRERGVPGVHLGVSPRNLAAQAFYECLGFVELPTPDPASVRVLGLTTGAGSGLDR